MNIVKSVRLKGIRIRELARQTNLPVSTVHLYINKFLDDKVKVENVKIGDLEQVK